MCVCVCVYIYMNHLAVYLKLAQHCKSILYFSKKECLPVGGGIGMGNSCKTMADSCQCMTKTTTIL